MSERAHLLPPNATPLERTIGAMTGRIDELPVPVQSVADPAACPAALLPWLAFQRGVRVWKAEWSLATKRTVVASEYERKKTMGTRFAVVSALAAEGFANIRYETWFEYGGPAYAFRVTLNLAPDAPWALEDARALWRTIIGAKSVRSWPQDIVINRPIEPGSQRIGGAVFISEIIQPLIEVPDVIDFPPDPLGVLGAVGILETLTLGQNA